jgi:hypothetical protein
MYHLPLEAFASLEVWLLGHDRSVLLSVVTQALLCHKFMDLQQGIDSVYENIEKFNYLAQYGTHHVDTDDKKAESYSEKDWAYHFRIEQEGTYRALLAEEEEKRKRVISGPSKDSFVGAPPNYHLVYTSSAGKSRVPPPSPQWGRHPPHQQQMVP